MIISEKIRKIVLAKENSDIIKTISLGFLLIIITFPALDFSFSIGIDPPLAWAFNYLFDKDLNLGKDLIFPHGPLAFLMYPTYHNALVGIGVKILLQLTFIYSISVLLKDYKEIRWLLLFIISFFLLKILSINHLILLIILCSFLNHFETKKLHFKIIGILLTALAIYIKAYVAIIAGLMTFSFLLIEYWKFRDWKKTLLTISIGISSIIFIWFAMYKSFNGLIRYFIGMLNLAQDNSAAAAYYPDNNWWFLGGFIIIVVFLPFIQKNKKGVLFASLFLFSLFGAWKHGIAREDIYHIYGLFKLTLSAMIIFVVYIKRNYFFNITLLTIAFSMFYINLTKVSGYNSTSLELIGVNNFTNVLSNFSSIIEKSENKTRENISIRKLPDRITTLIGNNSVDIYPWDYSIIAANNLNWQPRVVIHSYAAYTSWLDMQNAKHFSSDKSPAFLIWHLVGVTRTLGGLNSIDKRYLLNDEPNTIIELIKRYELVDSTSSVLVYKKRTKAATSNISTIKTEIGYWNKWIEVPKIEGTILRVKTDIKGNLKRSIKSLFYKDEAFYIYYKLTDNSIVGKKIVPKNALDGIWVNPFIQQPASALYEKNVKQIMLKCSNLNLLKQEIPLQWETITLNNNESNTDSYIFDFFGKSNSGVINDSLVLETTNSFEHIVPYWKFRPKANTSKIYYSNKHSLKLESKMFSPSFEYKMDSLPIGKLNILVNAQIYSEKESDSRLIISIENENGTLFWEAEYSERFIIDKNAWNYISHEVNFFNTQQENATIKIYFWNTGKNTLFIDDMNIKIKKLLNK